MKIPDFQRAKREGKKIVVVTGYDALFTRIIEQAGIEVILVGDSLGVVVQGKPDTLTVTMEDMVYHTRMVAGAAERALVVADMPFLSYQVSNEEAVRNAGRLIQAGAAAVKLEGGASVVERVQAMTGFGGGIDRIDPRGHFLGRKHTSKIEQVACDPLAARSGTLQRHQERGPELSTGASGFFLGRGFGHRLDLGGD